MESIRGSLSSIPNAVTNMLGSISIPTPSSFFPIAGPSRMIDQSPVVIHSSPPSTRSGDDTLDKSHAIPNSLITEEWQLILEEVKNK